MIRVEGTVTTDVELARRASAGDEGAQRAIFDGHAERVFRLAYRLTGDMALAEDFTQDVFVRALDRLGQYRGESSLATWLHTIATSVILNGLRQRKTWTQRTVSLEVGEMHGVATPSRRIEPDLQERLIAALAQMPDEQRLILMMYDVEGYSHDEIAAALGVSAGACRMRLSRARDALRFALGPHAEDWQ